MYLFDHKLSSNFGSLAFAFVFISFVAQIVGS